MRRVALITSATCVLTTAIAQAQPLTPTPDAPPSAAVSPTEAAKSDPKVQKAKFSLGRYFLEALAGGLVGSAAAYGTYKAAGGSKPGLGAALEALGADIVVTPLAVWGVGEAMGGNGSLGYSYVGGLVAFAGTPAGSSNPGLALAIGEVLMPFASAALYEMTSHIWAASQDGSINASVVPVYGPNGVVGAGLGLGGSF